MWRVSSIFLILLSAGAPAYQWVPYGPLVETQDFYTHDMAPYYTVLCGAESLYVETPAGWTAYGMASLPFISVAGLAGDTMLVALGDGSWSDGVYRFDLTSAQFSVLAWTPWPRFLIQTEVMGPYYSGYEYGLVRSADGSAWTDVPFFSGTACLAMAVHGSHYVVAVDAGVCWSDDGGQTWHQASGAPFLADLTFAPDGTLYGIFPDFSYSSGLWSSADFGQTWDVEFWSTEMSAVALDVQEVVFVGWEGTATPGGVAVWTPELQDLTYLNTGLPNRHVHALRRNGLIDMPSMVCCTGGGTYYVLNYLWPPSLSLDLIAPGTARLTWTPVGGSDHYEIFRSIDAFFTAEGAPWATVAAPATMLDVTEGIGDPSVNHFFRVRASNATQLSSPSNAVGEADFEATIPP